MSRNIKLPVYLLLWLNVFLGCAERPVPPEIELAVKQEHELWRAGAEIYSPQEFNSYRSDLRAGKERFVRESKRIRWFRDYASVEKEFKAVLNKGAQLEGLIGERKRQKADNLIAKSATLRKKIDTIKSLLSLSSEVRKSRRYIARAEILLAEAERHHEGGRYAEASARMGEVASDVEEAEKLASSVFGRYGDVEQIKKWRRWVSETLRESKVSGGHAIIVSKINRELTLYKKGVPFRVYHVGLGFNGLKDKMHAGDRATPEGRYHIVKKLPRSRYHKALLINYPNADDRRQFTLARKKGIIPKGMGIGGLIEIHGGGRNSLTYGCVALDNREMDELFSAVETGTPVTIVGATDLKNGVRLE